MREINLIMYSFTLIIAVSPSLKKSIFDLLETTFRRKEIMQEPDPPNDIRRSLLLTFVIANK